jgi:hypothetical protein
MYLGRDDDGTEEDTLTGPLLEGDLEVPARAADVGERDEDDRHLDVGAREHALGELCERAHVARGGAPACVRGPRALEGEVDRVGDGVNDVGCRARSAAGGEQAESRHVPTTLRETLASMRSRSSGL